MCDPDDSALLERLHYRQRNLQLIRHGAASCRCATRPVLRTRSGHPDSLVTLVPMLRLVTPLIEALLRSAAARRSIVENISSKRSFDTCVPKQSLGTSCMLTSPSPADGPPPRESVSQYPAPPVHSMPSSAAARPGRVCHPRSRRRSASSPASRNRAWSS